jgi:hypothetical protein
VTGLLIIYAVSDDGCPPFSSTEDFLWVEVRRLPDGRTLFRRIEIAQPGMPPPPDAQDHNLGGGSSNDAE